MNWLSIKTNENKTRFSPGEQVIGTVMWNVARQLKSIELRLFWYTQGKGDQDVGIVDFVAFDSPEPDGQRDFSLQLPEGPYSFSGKLISLMWALELVTDPSSEITKLNIVVSPTQEEILLYGATVLE